MATSQTFRPLSLSSSPLATISHPTTRPPTPYSVQLIPPTPPSTPLRQHRQRQQFKTDRKSPPPFGASVNPHTSPQRQLAKMVTRVKLMEQQQQQQQKQRQQQQQQNSASKPYRVASTGSMAQDSKNVRNNINATTDRLLKPHNTPVDHACDNVDEANPWPQDPLSGPSPNGSESTRPTPNPHPEQTGDSSATGVVTSDSSSASKSAPITTTTTTTTSSPPKSSQGKTSSGSSNSTSSHSPPPALQIYDIVRTIGKGNFAVVKLARHRMTRTEVRSFSLRVHSL